MKILFSEAKPDYGHYLFPYAIWALPEEGEAASDCMERGFLPASRNLDRFYLCRQVRIRLEQFKTSSENRRILRKGSGIGWEVIPRRDFQFTPERRLAWKHYSDIKFGKDVMTLQRLDNLLHSPLVTHLMVFRDTENQNTEVGAVTLFLEPPRTAFYYYSFYNLDYYERNLGMFMMTSAVEHFARENFIHLYLGSVYSKNALYKTQFHGAEFFNGFTWSGDLSQLKYLLRRDHQTQEQHLLESPDYLESFYPEGLPQITRSGGIRLS